METKRILKPRSLIVKLNCDISVDDLSRKNVNYLGEFECENLSSQTNPKERLSGNLRLAYVVERHRYEGRFIASNEEYLVACSLGTLRISKDTSVFQLIKLEPLSDCGYNVKNLNILLRLFFM